MKKRQKTIPLRERESSQKNSLVCRQCGKPIDNITTFIDCPELERYPYDICTVCFIKKHKYDHRQKNIDFNPDSL